MKPVVCKTLAVLFSGVIGLSVLAGCESESLQQPNSNGTPVATQPAAKDANTPDPIPLADKTDAEESNGLHIEIPKAFLQNQLDAIPQNLTDDPNEDTGYPFASTDFQYDFNDPSADQNFEDIDILIRN